MRLDLKQMFNLSKEYLKQYQPIFRCPDRRAGAIRALVIIAWTIEQVDKIAAAKNSLKQKIAWVEIASKEISFVQNSCCKKKLEIVEILMF